MKKHTSAETAVRTPARRAGRSAKTAPVADVAAAATAAREKLLSVPTDVEATEPFKHSKSDPSYRRAMRRALRTKTAPRSTVSRSPDGNSSCDSKEIVAEDAVEVCEVGPDIVLGGGVDAAAAAVAVTATVGMQHTTRWRKKVNELAYRGIRLGYILAFYQSLAEGNLRDSCGECLLPHFDPDRHTTTDVVRQAVIPMTRGTRFGDCAFATSAQDGQSTLATVMVSHHWRNLFCHTVASMAAFALGETSYGSVVQDLREHRFDELRTKLDRRDALQMAFWGCFFCVNQHKSICGSLPPEPSPSVEDQEGHAARKEAHWLETHDTVSQEQFSVCDCCTKKFWNNSESCEMDKFDAMMVVLASEAPKVAQRLHHIVCVDQEFECFSRIWVMAEIAKSQELELPMTALYVHDELSELNNVSELQRIKETLDIRQCKASRQEDVDAILSSIPDIDKFNDRLRKALFDKQEGLLEAHTARRCAGFFDVIDPLKDMFTDLQWTAPAIITIGQESNGKSTLMERLTGIPIFPRDAELCTRSIIKVRLRRGPTQNFLRLMVEDIETGQGEIVAHVARKDIGETVMREMTRQVRLEALHKEDPQRGAESVRESLADSPLQSSDGVSTRKLVVVEVTSPTSPNLDIVDCPGLVAASARGRPADVAATTTDLVTRYLKKHSDAALFLVAIKASDQPNNSLGMQLVQELGLEDRTLGVLTMTDVLTGDLTDGSTKLHSTFHKHHGPRLWALLCGEDDQGGSVHLGMGYVLTALHDIREDAGWANISRVDVMANWEQRYFQELAEQWASENSAVDVAALLDKCSCNSVWSHSKNAVDTFVRDHWLLDVVRLVQEEEAAVRQKEAALGLPRALSTEHRASLQRQTALLPGALRDAVRLPETFACGVGEEETSLRDLLAQHAEAALPGAIDKMWGPEGSFNGLVSNLEKQLVDKIPEVLHMSPTKTLPGCTSRLYDLGACLESFFTAVQGSLAERMADVRRSLQKEFEEAMSKDTSAARLGRMTPMAQHLSSQLEARLESIARDPGYGSLAGLRAACGVGAGCGFDASPWVQVEKVQRHAYSVSIDRKQILNRCMLLFHQYLDEVTNALPKLLKDLCAELPEAALAENCSEERFNLLSRLQNLRLSLARLRQEYGDDLLDQMMLNEPLVTTVSPSTASVDSPWAEGASERSSGSPQGGKQKSYHQRRQRTLVSADQAQVPEVVKVSGRAAKKRLQPPNTTRPARTPSPRTRSAQSAQ